MADPQLPSALSQLFTENDHFLPNSLIHPGLSDDIDSEAAANEAAAVAVAAAAAEQAAEQHHHEAQTQDHEQALHPEEHPAHAHTHTHTREPSEAPSREYDTSPDDDNYSALLHAKASLRGENDRLRRVITALEPEDEIAQSTLRELASAADGTLASFSLESLHQLDAMVSDDSTANPQDFLFGLVSQITSTPRTRPFDPFGITRAALEADIAITRAAIATKEAEIAAVKSPKGMVVEKGYDAQLHRASTAIEGARVRAKVLADVLVRTQTARDTAKSDLEKEEAELAEIGEDREAGAFAIAQVRAYLDDALRNYKEKGVLPTIPLPALPAVATPVQPPPSSLPKKRGRPPRSAQRSTVVPPQLLHLVPDSASVQARAHDTPLRRKGIKRNKAELDREKRREEEEGEMLRNLAGMGVWRQFEDDE